MLQELLLVDALQKFGSDYELLVASKTSSCCFKTPDDLPSEPVGAGTPSPELTVLCIVLIVQHLFVTL